MFTGIVEEQGRVQSIADNVLRIAAEKVLADATVGVSIAVNGCCLTVVRFGPNWWDADISQETLNRTSLGQLQPGDLVNLERPVRLEDRLGGHMVQGHVDAVGVIARAAPDLRINVPATLLCYIVEKGSITVDGVSLTVVQPDVDGFSVAVIPHTMAVTSLGQKGVGAAVNIEVDIIAKYVERLVEHRS